MIIKCLLSVLVVAMVVSCQGAVPARGAPVQIPQAAGSSHSPLSHPTQPANRLPPSRAANPPPAVHVAPPTVRAAPVVPNRRYTPAKITPVAPSKAIPAKPSAPAVHPHSFIELEAEIVANPSKPAPQATPTSTPKAPIQAAPQKPTAAPPKPAAAPQKPAAANPPSFPQAHSNVAAPKPATNPKTAPTQVNQPPAAHPAVTPIVPTKAPTKAPTSAPKPSLPQVQVKRALLQTAPYQKPVQIPHPQVVPRSQSKPHTYTVLPTRVPQPKSATPKAPAQASPQSPKSNPVPQAKVPAQASPQSPKSNPAPQAKAPVPAPKH